MNRNRMKSPNLMRSFCYALLGLVSAIKSERNLRIHLTAAVVVIGVGLFLSLTALEWAALVLTMGMVISTELINTAIEAAVDLTCPRPHPLAAVAKNAAAAAVLVTAITAVVVAWMLIWPKLLVALRL